MRISLAYNGTHTHLNSFYVLLFILELVFQCLDLAKEYKKGAINHGKRVPEGAHIPFIEIL
jgi:hypothetical protein